MEFSKFSIFKMIEKFLREKKIKRRQFVVFLSLALVVALATAGALKLTGVTRTVDLTVIKCPAAIHEHVDGCYNGENNLICGYADFVVHTHGPDCYCEGVLTCKLPEIKAHKHTENCYLREEYLAEDQAPEEQIDEGHSHTDACYTETSLLTCDPEESGEEEGHVHTDACYTVQKELSCGLRETESSVQISADKVYKVRETLVCEKEEIVLHTHTDGCFKEAVFDEHGTMVSLASRLPKDVTVPDSWTRGMVPACGQIQIEAHVHGAGCLDTIKLPPEEVETYVSTLRADAAQSEPDDSRDYWSGTKKGAARKDIGNDDGTKTIQVQFTWSVTINFPDDESWTDFTYTDSFRQTMTGWILQENGEKVWAEDYPIHHYQIRSQLEKELTGALKLRLAEAGLENDLSYTFVYKDPDGNEVVDGGAEVVGFEIRFGREAGQNLHGRSISFDYTSIVDTQDFVDRADYMIGSDFTLPGFEGTGDFYFQYTDRVTNESETGDISVKKIWRDVKGGLLTDGIPGRVQIILKQYAFKGGIYFTEEPEDPENWCKLTLYIYQSEADDRHDVWVKSLSGEVLGKNKATVWIPMHALVQFSADYRDFESGEGTAPSGNWSYTFNLKDVFSCELTIIVNDDSDNVFLNVIGKAPAGFKPSGESVQYSDVITLDADCDWSYIWEQLPMNDDHGTQYVYTIEEVQVPDGFYDIVEDDGNGAFTVTNRKQMEPGKITVDIKWIDTEGNPLVTHPDEVEVVLQKKVAKGVTEDGGDDFEWVTVENSGVKLPNEKGEWIASWTGLEEGEYRVAEKEIGGGYAYICTYTVYDSEGNKQTNMESLPGNAGFVTVTNIYVIAEDGETVVVKIWEYEDGTPDPDHPDSITIVIKRAKKASGSETEPPSETTTVPVTSGSEPVTSGSTPVTSGSTPVTSGSTPVTSGSTPVTSGSTPVTSGSTPVTSGTEPVTTEPNNPPKTGDETNLLLYIIPMLISGGGLLAAALYGFMQRDGRKKKK